MTVLEFARKIRGLPQSKLGARADVHPATISHLERGRIPSWPALRRRLAEALETPEEELFDEKGFAREA